MVRIALLFGASLWIVATLSGCRRARPVLGDAIRDLKRVEQQGSAERTRNPRLAGSYVGSGVVARISLDLRADGTFLEELGEPGVPGPWRDWGTWSSDWMYVHLGSESDEEPRLRAIPLTSRLRITDRALIVERGTTPGASASSESWASDEVGRFSRVTR